MIPVALTIAGSDSGGGAGIQADLKTFASFNVYGTSAITCITAQNPSGVTGIQPVALDMIEKQIHAIIDYFPLNAVKTGMLYSAEIIHLVASLLYNFKGGIVVDPVMVATSGANLLQDEAIGLLRSELLPLASLITPNLDEMTILLDGYTINSVESMKKAVYLFYELYSVPVLLKGGHLPNSESAIDILFDGNIISEFSGKYVKGINTHGTGCTYSSAITASLILGHNLGKAVQMAKKFLQKSIEEAVTIGDEKFLNHSVKSGFEK